MLAAPPTSSFLAAATLLATRIACALLLVLGACLVALDPNDAFDVGVGSACLVLALIFLLVVANRIEPHAVSRVWATAASLLSVAAATISGLSILTSAATGPFGVVALMWLFLAVSNNNPATTLPTNVPAAKAIKKEASNSRST